MRPVERGEARQRAAPEIEPRWRHQGANAESTLASGG
jgi:hypothetical protein